MWRATPAPLPVCCGWAGCGPLSARIMTRPASIATAILDHQQGEQGGQAGDSLDYCLFDSAPYRPGAIAYVRDHRDLEIASAPHAGYE